MITVVDYGRGNLFSTGQALRHLGAPYEITNDAGAVERAERIVLPGVGAFGDCMDGLRTRDLVEPLKRAAARGVPILGICVGAQVMLEAGEEFGRHDGLGLVAGTVRRLPEGNGSPDSIRIPNVGWRALQARGGFFEGAPESAMVYFVHSYAPFVARDEDVAATIAVNGMDVPVAFRRGNVVGFQFHPEKSGPVGLGLIERFVHFAP
ncbi:MAG: imidazole glycerol phosphate synthase subunit HisH [Alphaproteobacteria bacterium]|nr:imidazole glycerol phosphate synthase subunit HisH [Alphaproteobacteria bacterium]